MELKICITTKRSTGETSYVRETFTEADLLEWAKAQINERYDGRETLDMAIESIIP